MIKIIYRVPVEDAASELAWLKEQKVWPSTHAQWDHNLKEYRQFGMIVGPEAALAIKLRHPLQLQVEYHGR